MSNRKMKILWAVDPFEESHESRIHVKDTIKHIALLASPKIEPVYVLSPPEEEMSDWVREHQDAAKKALNSMLDNMEIPGLLEPKIIVEKAPPLSRAVKTLCRYARTHGFDLILTGTHARKGLPRLVLGSFAESLFLHSKIPALVVGPSSVAVQMNHILFATDFSEKSEELFQRIIVLAKAFRAKLTIYHVLNHPVEPLVQSGVYLMGGGWISTSEYINQKEAENTEIAKVWAQEARKKGIDTDIFCDTRKKTISQAILEYANTSHANLIAMAAESSGVEATLIGSTTREVVRNARCPVWVMKVNG